MGFLDRLWKAISEVQFGDMPGSGAVTEDARKRAQAIAPVVWLLGKTGAGKTAIVAALTGDPRAEVGEGFEPCTRTAAFYDVPPEAPLLRFLDARGLGEADYDPAMDIALVRGPVTPLAGRDAGGGSGSAWRAARSPTGAQPTSGLAGRRSSDRPPPSLPCRHRASKAIPLYGRP